MPELRPKPNEDGSCATYPVDHNDGCSMIAVARQLTVDDLEEFNKNTWGWQGCEAPMPNPVENAECGPTVPGTKPPPAGISLADLNQCPLKVCCNIWGHCGFSDDFCTVSKSKSGAPGTAALGINGCVSNCGRYIVGSPSAPEKPLRIGYFEAWNKNRNCLTMDNHELDGIDIDWEYPGSYLSASKSVSFAIPASYWYLKAFPIAMMSKRFDYIVFMTDALAMITKAGVPANKIALEIATYGRSFKMAAKGCWGPMCLFTGTNRISNAAEGRCTKTAGYISNAEIQEIIQYGNVNKQWEAVGSHVLVYNDTEWVAYMDDDDKKKRADYFSQSNFGGTSEWAIDLRRFSSTGTGMDQQLDESFIEIRCDGQYTTFDAVERALQAMHDALDRYKKLVDGGYDDKFNYYSNYIKMLVPMQIDEFMASGKADDYFTCQGTMYGYHCSDCQWGGCLDSCRRAEDCKSGMYTEKVKCPDTLKYRESGVLPEHYRLMSADYHLDDIEGFWKEWAKNTASMSHGWPLMIDCARKSDFYFHHYPKVKDDMKVPNPKDVIGKSYNEALDLLKYFKIARSAIIYDSLAAEDLLDAISVSAFTYQSAVEKMDAIVKEVKTIKKNDLKEFILDFITGVIMLVPGIGEALGPEMAATRSFLRLLGDVGDAGTLIYGVVEDPSSGLMRGFGAFAAVGLSRSGILKASESRRGMSDTEIESGEVSGDGSRAVLIDPTSCIPASGISDPRIAIHINKYIRILSITPDNIFPV
ncbi:hypothetical protein PWT90_08759 [Aphanocladium album]|nr:hypothetical protein PWT90_08759 [Aphanocladium album]